MGEEDYEIHKLEGSLDEVRNQLNEINLNEQFIIFALDYGVGKTTFIENKIISGELPEGNFFSRRHDRIDETTKEFDDKGFNEYRHLYGFGYVKDNKALGCPKFLKNEDIKKLYSHCHLSPNLICQIVCKGKKCEYRKQFDDNKKWKLAPHEFLNIIQPKAINLIDEDVSGRDKSKYPGKLDFDVLKKYTENRNIPKAVDYAIIKAAQAKEVEDLQELIKIKTKHETFFKVIISRIKPSDGYVSIPRIYRIFDYLRQGANVVLLDGGFNLDLFDYFWGEYLKVHSNITLPNPIIYTSDLKNKQTKVIRVNPHKDYYRGDKGDRRWQYDTTFISEPLQLIKALKMKGKQIGIITPKEIEEKFKGDGIITSHYGDTSGSNKFVDCTALILLGEDHWGHKKISKSYFEYFGVYLIDEQDREIRRKRQALIYKMMHSRSIEAGFRIRPLEYDVDIYFFRKVLDIFKDKFTYEEKKIDDILEELAPRGKGEFDVFKMAKIITHHIHVIYGSILDNIDRASVN